MNWGEYLLDHWWKLIVLGVLLVGSGFFSGTETAMFNLTRGQVHRLKHSGTRTGQLLASLMHHPRRLLQTLLLSNMIVNTAYSAMTAIVVLALVRRGAPTWATLVVASLPLLVLILVGEVTPKMLAYRFGERWSLLAVAPTAILVRFFTPVVQTIETVIVAPLTRMISPRPTAPSHMTAEELGKILDLSAARGLIGHNTSALLQEITQLTDIHVSDIMVPRVDIVAYDVNDSPVGLVKLFGETHLHKIPVYDGNIDSVLGVVHAKRLLLDPSQELRALVTKVPFIPEAANIERALLQFRTNRKQIGFVVDEYGGLAGLVTLEDIIEEIVGDIEEAPQEQHEPPVEQIAEREYLLNGDLAIHEWLDAFRIDLGEQRISTIGGFVISLLGRIPNAGDVAKYRNLRFTVEAMRGRRISRVRLELLEESS